MKISHPSVEKVIQLLTTPEKGQDWFDGLHIVDRSPELAKEPAIETIIVAKLQDWMPGVRWQCAKILARLGNPRGILHLTYNALSVHPKLGGDATQKHQEIVLGARKALLPHADQLTEQCIDLLLEDMLKPTGNMHVDVLVGLKSARLHEVLKQYLTAPLRTAVQAAHVMARDGDGSGKAILLQCLEVRKHIELSVMGLSYLADADAALALDAVRDGSHESVKALPKEYLDKIVRKVDLRVRLRDATDTQAKIDAICRYFAMPVSECFANYLELKSLVTGGMDQKVILQNPLTVASLCDVLYDVQDPAVCTALADIQRRSVSQLLKINGFIEHYRELGSLGTGPSIFSGLVLPPSANKIPDWEIIFDEADYLNASVDWLLRPGKYRQGLVGPYIAIHMREDLY